MKKRYIIWNKYTKVRKRVSFKYSIAHKDIIITKDLIHFFRHIYEKYSPITNKANQYKLVYEMCLRIRIRKKLNFLLQNFLKNLKSKILR